MQRTFYGGRIRFLFFKLHIYVLYYFSINKYLNFFFKGKQQVCQCQIRLLIIYPPCICISCTILDIWSHKNISIYIIISNIPYSLVAQPVKSLPAMHETRVHPWVGKMPQRRKQQSTPVFLPGKSHGRRISFQERKIINLIETLLKGPAPT